MTYLGFKIPYIVVMAFVSLHSYGILLLSLEALRVLVIIHAIGPTSANEKLVMLEHLGRGLSDSEHVGKNPMYASQP